MILINLAYINASNGMFWYAMDKIKSIGPDFSDCLVLVQPHLAALVSAELPRAQVSPTGRLRSVFEVVRQKISSRSDVRVVTFTSHPLPFVGRQTVAFYDAYPFEGAIGAIKGALFFLGARTSRCRVGIINRSAALPYLRRLGVPECRTFFDSAFPTVSLDQIPVRHISPSHPMRVGLVGTDSRKKNYDQIFQSVRDLNAQNDIEFVLYGSENDYTMEMKNEFADIRQYVIPSDDVPMLKFFESIDYIVSAAVGEGYGRPMGLASVAGVPMFLLKAPVFMEFFSESASFFDDVDSIISHIVRARPSAQANASATDLVSTSRSPFFD